MEAHLWLCRRVMFFFFSFLSNAKRNSCFLRFSYLCSLTDFILFLYTGTPYLQQSYKVSDSFPFKWINKKWREGFYVTSMATAGSKWGIVMSRGAAFSDQVLCCFYFLFFDFVTLKIYGESFFCDAGCRTRFSIPQ